MPPVIFRKGLDLKHEVAGVLAESYHSELVNAIKANDYRHHSGRLTIFLAREFGFCYGVDRAVDYAYQARRRFPDRRVFLTGEIIHNPHVNDQLRAQGIRFLSDQGEDNAVTPDDVVVLPAFGVTVEELQRLSSIGCTLVDTTCGSVLNVWKNVSRYAREGYTSVIHGKFWHEETRATASQATQVPGGHYLVVLDRGRGGCGLRLHPPVRVPGSRAAGRVRRAIRSGRHRRVSIRTCTWPESAVPTRPRCSAPSRSRWASSFRTAMRDRYGDAELATRFRSFDTICSATQDRQDAVVKLLAEETVDLMLVIGGYNSSNTCNLARICAEHVPTFHVAGPDGLVSADEIRHRSVADKREVVSTGWLAGPGDVRVGLTSGASTPDNLVEIVVRKLEAFTQP